MDLKFWLEKWKSNDIKFHQEDVEPHLVKYLGNVKPGKVFVPLCGKSKDMLWLAQRGWDVVGVEISPIGCEAFFVENQLSFEKVQSKDFTLYKGQKISIWCGDLFKLEKDQLSDVSAIYDRAALIALPPDVRPKYVSHVEKLLGEKSYHWLLISLEYPQDKIEGPPHSVAVAEVKRLFSPSFDIAELVREEDSFLPKNNPRFSEETIIETVYMMKHL